MLAEVKHLNGKGTVMLDHMFSEAFALAAEVKEPVRDDANEMWVVKFLQHLFHFLFTSLFANHSLAVHVFTPNPSSNPFNTAEDEQPEGTN